ncbi:MAG: PQQ-binding-like beta-propeller repeat protein [Sandaracinaceae bacterium]
MQSALAWSKSKPAPVRNRAAALAVLVGVLTAGCAPGLIGGGDYGWLDGRHSEVSTRSIRLRWREQLTPTQGGAYIPVQRAAPVLDPANDRLYVGSTTGELWALSAGGSRIYTYDSGSSIGAQPAFDGARDEIYLPTEGGVLHMLTASTGRVQWRAEVGGAVSTAPVLTDDAVYVVTDDDIVVALAREDGEALWRVRREAPEGFSVSEHAGLALVERRLLTGFTNGVVMALSPADGSILWERDTAQELEPEDDGAPRFVDVDSTPAVVGETVFAASFAGGLFALEIDSGTVLWRDETLTGISAITAAGPRLLLLSSGDLGLVCFDHVSREIIWQKRLPRGAPAPAVVADDLVLFGETQGGFVTAALSNGAELGRIEVGHGFSARPSIRDGRGFVLSNGGGLFAFTTPQSQVRTR